MNLGKRHENMILALCAAILTGVGAVMVYSASSVTAQSAARLGHDAAYFFKRQVLFAAVGASAALVLARIDYDFYRRWIWPIMGATLALLVLVFVPGIRHAANGASRWIDLRVVTFQPSEAAKFVLVAYAAYAIDRRGENPRDGWKAFVPMLAVMAGYVVLILKEPDFGMAVVIAASFVAVLYIAGLPWRLLGGLVGAGALGVVVLI